jgi:hypothetical protein
MVRLFSINKHYLAQNLIVYTHHMPLLGAGFFNGVNAARFTL